MNELSLFTGAGGGVWASKLLGHRVVGYVEIEDYCQKVLKARIDDGSFDNAPIFTDIRTFINKGYAESYKGMVDLVSGGFPCQDISAIGKGAGLNGVKSGLWREFRRVIELVRPKYVFLENSPILSSRGLGQILADLTKMGFDAEWCNLGADTVGGEHHRRRLWLLAFPAGQSGVQTDQEVFAKRTESSAWKRLNRCNRLSAAEPDWYLSESLFTRKTDDVPDRKHRAIALGNGQLPVVAATAFRILKG